MEGLDSVSRGLAVIIKGRKEVGEMNLPLSVLAGLPICPRLLNFLIILDTATAQEHVSILS